MAYHATCPECKNDINLTKEVSDGEHFECAACGITLEAHGIKTGDEICEIENPEIVEMEK